MHFHQSVLKTNVAVPSKSHHYITCVASLDCYISLKKILFSDNGLLENGFQDKPERNSSHSGVSFYIQYLWLVLALPSPSRDVFSRAVTPVRVCEMSPHSPMLLHNPPRFRNPQQGPNTVFNTCFSPNGYTSVPEEDPEPEDRIGALMRLPGSFLQSGFPDCAFLFASRRFPYPGAMHLETCRWGCAVGAGHGGVGAGSI